MPPRGPAALVLLVALVATAATPASALRLGVGRRLAASAGHDGDVPPSRPTPPCPTAPATAELPPSSVAAALGRHFDAGKLAALAPTLATLPADEVASRVGQAAYLLDGVAAVDGAPSTPPHEAEVLRASLVAQPQYFSQPFGVVYEDANLLIVDKPFDTQIDAKRNGRRWRDEITVVEWLEARRRRGCFEGAATAEADPSAARPCHTLDYATSGLLLMAKTDAALAQASVAFDASSPPPSPSTSGTAAAGPARYRVAKEYRAVVLGWPEWDATTVRCDLEADPSSPFKMRPARRPGDEPSRPSRHVVDAAAASRWGPSRLPPAPAMSRDGRAAKPRPTLTEVRVEVRGHYALPGPLAGKEVAIVRLFPHTGRRHQLRVVMAEALGHPIVGDVAYAGDLSTYRLMLHAEAVTLMRREEEEEEDEAEGAAGSGGGGVPVQGQGQGRRARARARAREKAEAEAAAGGGTGDVGVAGVAVVVDALEVLEGLRITTDPAQDPFAGVVAAYGT